VSAPPRRTRIGITTWTAAVATGALTTAAVAATFYVDGGSGSCSDAGPGSSSNPYCTITAALTAHHAAGTTIAVRPGIYREQVGVPGSGAAGSPIVLQALPGPGSVIVSGSNNLAGAGNWTAVQGNVWLASSVDWSPVQVFSDGARLATATGDPTLIPTNSFEFVSGTGLYVNLGGGNPGTHVLEVGKRAFGFSLSSRSYVTIDGFTVTRCEDRGIRVGASSHIEVTRDTVSYSGHTGIQLITGSSIHLDQCRSSNNADHGIGLITGTTASLIERCESDHNVFPTMRSANGIYLFGSTGNTVRMNRVHDNQDTGIDLQPGANDNVLSQNVSYANGDHGYDHLHATGNVHVGDVAWGNFKDGFSIEGNSNTTSLANCIAANNGLTTNEFDLWVDDSSSVGFSSDDNVFWNSTSQSPVKYRFTLYSTVAAYSAVSGKDTRTKQADPLFVNPVLGDFHLSAGSPAIDDGNSGVPGWPSHDADGNARGDDPMTPNTGLGPIAVADRGAYEYTAAGTVAVDPPPAPAPDGAATALMIPNPMRSSATLTFTLARPGPITVSIYDLRGRLVRTLDSQADAASGPQRITFDGRSFSGEPLIGGVYFFRIRSPGGAAEGRFVVMR
jgi:parallel beta-helix repeat protein